MKNLVVPVVILFLLLGTTGACNAQDDTASPLGLDEAYW